MDASFERIVQRLFVDGGASWEALFFGVITTAFIFYSSLRREKSMYIENIQQIRQESEKERDFFEIQSLVKTERKQDLKKAIHKNMDFYYNHIDRNGGGKASPLDQSILLTNAILAVNVKDATSVAEVFRIARLVAPQKERAFFSRSSGKNCDPIPEALFGLLKRRTDYLATHFHSTTSNSADTGKSIGEIVLLWQEFFDICAACDYSGGEKYIELSNQYVLTTLNRMMEIWHPEGYQGEESIEGELNDLIIRDLPTVAHDSSNDGRGRGARRMVNSLVNIWHRFMLKA